MLSSSLRSLRLRQALAAPLLLCGLVACHDKPPPLVEGYRDLLRAGPDLVFDQPGEFRADMDTQWGGAGRIGWKLYTGKLGGNLPFVWADRSSVELLLPVCDARDRTIEFNALIPNGGQPDRQAELTVRLNDMVLGVETLTTRERRISLDAPAELWKPGPNRLEFALPELIVIETPEGLRDFGVGVGNVAYGTRHLVQVAPQEGELALDPRTRVGYQLEPKGEVELEVQASTDGDGVLEIHWELLDAGLGGPSGESSLLARIPAEDGRLVTRIPLHEVVPRTEWPLRLTLGWNSGDSEPLEFERLGLHEVIDWERAPILFISIDTLAAGRLSLYGYERETTPELERFAQDAVVFENCSTNASWTLPSYLSVMTGLYPYAHLKRTQLPPGTQRHIWDSWGLAENRWTMAEMLRARGYRTGGFVDNAWLTERFNFPQGFEPWSYDWSAGKVPPADPEQGVRKVLSLARDWLDTLAPQEPYFLFLHAFDVHGPYVPEEGWDGAFDGDSLYDGEQEVLVAPYDQNHGVIPEYIARAEYPEPQALPEQMRTAPLAGDYDEGVLAMDAQLGEFFDWLRAQGLYDRALIVVTADHGETAVEHDFYFGHGVLWEEVRQVPLMIKLPNGENGGTRIATPVQLVDLYPTFQEWAGGGGTRTGLHGRSLLSALRGEELQPLPVFCEGGIMRQTAVELNGWKLIEYRPSEHMTTEALLSWPGLDRAWLDETYPELEGGYPTPERLVRILERVPADVLIRTLKDRVREPRYSLYYLPDDPGEQRDLYAPDHEQALVLHGILATQQAQSETAQDNGRPDNKFWEFSAEELEQLHDIGYGGGDLEDEG